MKKLREIIPQLFLVPDSESDSSLLRAPSEPLNDIKLLDTRK
jgi:hypothetical protein